MPPGGGTVVAFCGRILALGSWMICKCLGANARWFPGVNPSWVATDKCIKSLNQSSINPCLIVHLVAI